MGRLFPHSDVPLKTDHFSTANGGFSSVDDAHHGGSGMLAARSPKAEK
jgi:hypothetical protein